MIAPDDRQTLVLMLLPVLLLATALTIGQGLRAPPRLAPLLEAALPPVPTLPTASPGDLTIAALDTSRSRPAPAPAPARPLEIESTLPRLAYAPALPSLVLPQIDTAKLPPLTLAVAAPDIAAALPTIAGPALAMPLSAPLVEVPQIGLAILPALRIALAAPEVVPQPTIAGPALSLPATPPTIDLAEIDPQTWPPLVLAALPPTVDVTRPEALLGPMLAYAPIVPVIPPQDEPAAAGICLPRPPIAGYRAAGRLASPPLAEFGATLAAAARAQMDDLVIYSARYQRIAYPMGDIGALHGACTDVVIRAYRALGLDLQALVQQSGVGSGDPSIDHRRTETLRRFFAAYGESLPVSAFPEDYKPGDIVTYYRPFSRVSRAHIAVISDVISPTLKPMIIHNRGWGIQLEDALFVDRITGHYRFDGTRLAPASGARPQVAGAADRQKTLTIRNRFGALGRQTVRSESIPNRVN